MSQPSFFITIPNLETNTNTAYISRDIPAINYPGDTSIISTVSPSNQRSQLLYIPPAVLRKNAELLFFGQYKNLLSLYTILSIWVFLTSFIVSYFWIPIAIICVIGRFCINRFCLYISTAFALLFDLVLVVLYAINGLDILGINGIEQIAFRCLFLICCSIFSIYVSIVWAKLDKENYTCFRQIALGLKHNTPYSFYMNFFNGTRPVVTPPINTPDTTSVTISSSSIPIDMPSTQIIISTPTQNLDITSNTLQQSLL